MTEDGPPREGRPDFESEIFTPWELEARKLMREIGDGKSTDELVDEMSSMLERPPKEGR